MVLKSQYYTIQYYGCNLVTINRKNIYIYKIIYSHIFIYDVKIFFKKMKN